MSEWQMAFINKYGDLADVVRAVNNLLRKKIDFDRPYNRDMETPVTLADVDQAEDEMLSEIRAFAKNASAAPQREWVSLTDEDIAKRIRSCSGPLSFARLIEAALKGKNHAG